MVQDERDRMHRGDVCSPYTSCRLNGKSQNEKREHEQMQVYIIESA